MFRPPIPLETLGQLTGLAFVVYAFALTYRHKWVDGYQYPLHIPAGSIVAGLGVMLLVTGVTVSDAVQSFWFTYLGYVLLFIAGTIVFIYFWWVYPEYHPCASERPAD